MMAFNYIPSKPTEEAKRKHQREMALWERFEKIEKKNIQEWTEEEWKFHDLFFKWAYCC